mgnify:CR=1 FL=1|jgi:glyoxylase-like metal-dependent hydrolase (beta-lactamase superfamily II)
MPAQPARLAEVKVGDIRIVFLPDGSAALEPTAAFPETNKEIWQSHSKWLDHQGRLVASFGSFLIRTGARNILVDLGFGDKGVDFPGFGPLMGGALLESLRIAKLEPGDIDTVVYTHLHLDHVGWTSHAVGHTRVPTFPRARHLTMKEEWEYWYGKDDPLGPDRHEVQDHLENCVEFVSDGQAIAPGVNILATPGHTPGHLSVVISSGTERAILFGDSMHCPVQFEATEWAMVADVDKELAKRTRERVIRELEDPSTFGAAAHFSNFIFGRLMLAEGKRQWTMVA